MTTVNIKLIVKVINGNAISVIVEDKKIPSMQVSNLYPDIDETIELIAGDYNIHSSYVQPKLVTVSVDNNEVYIYYTILAPKDFLDEKTISKLFNNFIELSECDRLAIRQAISVFPY